MKNCFTTEFNIEIVSALQIDLLCTDYFYINLWALWCVALRNPDLRLAGLIFECGIAKAFEIIY